MVFLEDAVLTNLLNFVGGGQYLFVGGVNRQWRSLYGKISKDKKGKLVTKYSIAAASISMLEYACACGLGIAEDPFKLGSGGFGPGVYAWARENGYPLLVWVALRLISSDGPPGVDHSIAGVYATVEVAEEGAIQELCSVCSREPEDVKTYYKWQKSWGNAWTMSVNDYVTLKVHGFVVNDIPYAKQIELGDQIPMYVLTEDIDACCSPPFELVGVFSSKEAVNRVVDERIERARADEEPDESEEESSEASDDSDRAPDKADDNNKETDAASGDPGNASDGKAVKAAPEDERAGLRSYTVSCVCCSGDLGSIRGVVQWGGYLKYTAFESEAAYEE